MTAPIRTILPLLTCLALVSALALAGCQKPGESEPAVNEPAGNEPTEEAPVKEAKPDEAPKMAPTGAAHNMKAGHGEDMEKLPVEKRVAFMSGHVEAGLSLYRAGAPEQAAKHLLHPVSETHQAERKGIDALGFEAAAFEAVSKALDEGRPAAEIEPMLKKAEENMALLQKNAGGDPAEIIAYLMDTVDEEYAIGVKAGKITDPGEYQDAFGFSVVAHHTAKRVEGDKAKATLEALEALIALWPKGGPLADSTPSTVADVTAHTAKVKATLATLR